MIAQRDWLPRADVVVCTFNRPARLRRCLTALSTQRQRGAVIVVDSEPLTDEACAICEEHGATYHRSTRKALSHARNVGCRAGDAEIIAFLDDDMIPHEGWLRALLSAFVDNRVAAATGPVLPDTALGLQSHELRRIVALSTLGSEPISLDRHRAQWFERANFGGIGDGNFALRRSILATIDGFHEHLGRGAAISSGEEHYAFFRIIKAGYQVSYVPQAVVFHPATQRGPSTEQKRVQEAISYALFLAWRHPLSIARLAKYLIEACFGKERSWRNPRPQLRARPDGETSLDIAAYMRAASAGLKAFLRSPK